ncbi:uncharacterized protein LOC141901170 isoform X2 [Tubulanus polymorphus]|uniref:uncharacterized protein LOC141901170 isoform X2 n=1 Tax=Tubulanus polymorphus TaxID=672921 RepID=UPI003DA579AA
MESMKTNLELFVEYVGDLEAEDCRGYICDYRELKLFSAELRQDERNFPCRCGKLEENQYKNRFRDIIPFDNTRVILKPYKNQPNTDYINASCIKGMSSNMGYIAAQGPLPNTIGDFWRMIWQYKVNILIMAGKEEEIVDGKVKKKCERYWPEGDEMLVFADITITLKNAEWPSQHYAVRTLSMKLDGEVRELIQFHFISWPDKKAPDSLVTLVDMLANVSNLRIPGVPILVHCSAGCGRTGTIITIDYAKNLLDNNMIDDDFTIYDMVRSLREQRPAMVQTLEQYILVHRTVNVMFKNELKLMENFGLADQVSEDEEDPYVDVKNLKSAISCVDPYVNTPFVQATEFSNDTSSPPPKPPRLSDSTDPIEKPDVLRTAKLFESNDTQISALQKKSLAFEEKTSKKRPSATPGCNIFSTCAQANESEHEAIRATAEKQRFMISDPIPQGKCKNVSVVNNKTEPKPKRASNDSLKDTETNVVKDSVKPSLPVKPKSDVENLRPLPPLTVKPKSFGSKGNDSSNRETVGSVKSLGEIISKNLGSSLPRANNSKEYPDPVTGFSDELIERSKVFTRNTGDAAADNANRSLSINQPQHGSDNNSIDPIPPPPPKVITSSRRNLPPPPPAPPLKKSQSNSLERQQKQDSLSSPLKSHTLNRSASAEEAARKGQSNSLDRQNKKLTFDRKLSEPGITPINQKLNKRPAGELISHHLTALLSPFPPPPPPPPPQPKDQPLANKSRIFDDKPVEYSYATARTGEPHMQVTSPSESSTGYFHTKSTPQLQDEDGDGYFEVKMLSNRIISDYSKDVTTHCIKPPSNDNKPNVTQEDDISIYSRERFSGNKSAPSTTADGNSIYATVTIANFQNKGEPDRFAFGVRIGYPNRLDARPSGGRPCPDHSMINWLC